MRQTSRENPEIIALILQAADIEGSSTKLTIMFKSFLSFSQVEYYLERLVDDGLLEYLAGEMKYRSTPEGLQVLRESEERETPVPCRHQCTRCGVIYDCESSGPCSSAFHLGRCTRCVAVFEYKTLESPLSL